MASLDGRPHVDGAGETAAPAGQHDAQASGLLSLRSPASPYSGRSRTFWSRRPPSHVQVDYFDHAGVEQFRRSAQSLLDEAAADLSTRQSVLPEGNSKSDSSSSTSTAVGSFAIDPPESFSLEKTIRDILRR